MNIVTIIMIAIGLAMDCFAVSITRGATIKTLKINNALKIGLFFGLFQAIMPLIGWLAGLGLKEFISDIDHWIAFGLLSFIGCKMIYESFKMDTKEKEGDPLNITVLVMLSVATSIDALAVGVTFAFLRVFITSALLIIGVVTFLFSFTGSYIGHKLGHFFENRIEIIGGLILIGIGTKILIGHLNTAIW